MNRKEYYDILLRGVGDTATVTRIVRGVAWTAAVLSDGRTGVAMHTQGESIPRMTETLVGLSAAEAARAALSWNFEEAGEGMAVINAWYNSADRIDELGCTYTDSALQGVELAGKTVCFIGHLIHHSGLTEKLVAPAARVWIIEREPRPGDYPDSACEYLLPQCDVAVITGSAAVNKTMPRLLELAEGKEIILTGPTVTLCPELLELGIARLNGQAITDPEPMLRAIAEKRCSVNAFSRHFTLDR